MKKIILSTLTAIACLTASAQKPVQFGVKAGVTLPHMTVSAAGASVSFSSKTSFYVGGIADIRVSNLFSVQPGLSLVNKGTKIGSAGFDFEEEAITEEQGTINLMYLEVPVNLMLNLKTGNSGKVFVGAGPYYALGLAANAKVGSEKEDITFGSDEDDIRRGEFGFNFLGGYQLNNGLNFHLNYGLGISSVIPDQEFDIKFKNRVFSFGVGFMF
jgi:hypothetical protein